MEIIPEQPSTKGPAEWFTGAAPDQLMTHLSLTDGGLTWGDQVTDDE